MMDLAANGFTAAATGNVVVAAVALMKFFGNSPDPASVAQQQILFSKIRAIHWNVNPSSKSIDY